MKEIIVGGMMLSQAFISPTSPTMQAAAENMHRDIVACEVYYTYKADQLASPAERTVAVMSIGRATSEGQRLRDFFQIPERAYTTRYAYVAKRMKADVDGGMWFKVFASYDAMCKDILEEPGSHFISKVQKQRKGRSE